MTYLTGEVTVLHDQHQIDFANFIYSAVKFGSTDGTSVIINGSSMTKVAGVTIDILVDYKTTDLGINGQDVYFLGNPRPTLTESIEGGVDEYITKYSILNGGPATNTQINCGTDPSQDFDGDVTLSCWAFPRDNDPGEDGYLIERYVSDKGWGLKQERPTVPAGDTVWAFRIGDNTAPSPFDLLDTTHIEINRWYHVVGVLEGTEMRLYVNGIRVSTGASDNPMVHATATQDLRLGSQSGAAAEFFGNLNNASIWTSALTDEEVLEVFNGGRPMDLNLHAPQRASLYSWWKVGDDAGWDGLDYTIPDQVGPNNGISTSTVGWGIRQINAPKLNVDD